MGGAASFNPLNLRSPFFLITIAILTGPLIVAEPDNHDTTETTPVIPSLNDYNGGISPPPPTGNSVHEQGKSKSRLNPGTIVVVGVLTTMFSLTFLLLLYIKHCSGANSHAGANNTNPNSNPSSAARKNSGIDRAVVESLPVFRFGSLMGQKDGLDCAVCLTQFEAPETLRLLPKCKHAFHVECVDAWLDAHSTCPICRYRVDQEDGVLIEDAKTICNNQPVPPSPEQNDDAEDIETGRVINATQQSEPRRDLSLGFRRVISGRHSLAEERDGGLLQITLQTENGKEQQRNPETSSCRKSLDSSSASTIAPTTTSGKDGTLLIQNRERRSVEHRLEHRIIVSPSSESRRQRWSDMQLSDLLYLTSEMIISDSSSSSRQQLHQNMLLPWHWISAREGRRTVQSSNTNIIDDGGTENNSGVVNWRSVSEITGPRRFVSSDDRNRGHREEQQRRRREGTGSRWLAWISKSRPNADGRGE